MATAVTAKLTKTAKAAKMVIKKLLILSTAGSRDGIVAETAGTYEAALKAIGTGFAVSLKAFTG